MELTIDYIYEEMGFNVVSSMFQEALLLGISVVLFNYLRKAFKDQIDRGRLIKDLILLFSLMLFCTYVDVSYQVDMGESARQLSISQKAEVEKAVGEDIPQVVSPNTFPALGENPPIVSAGLPGTEEKPKKEELSPQATAEIIYWGKWLVVCMLPFDLLTLLLIIGMFVVILLERTPQIFDKKDPAYDLIYQIGLLLLLTAAWHLVVVFWWLTWYSITGQWEGWQTDIFYHSAFAIFDLLCFLAWRHLLLRNLNESNRNRMEWVAVLSYSGILISVYASRLVMYVDKLAEGIQQISNN